MVGLASSDEDERSTEKSQVTNRAPLCKELHREFDNCCGAIVRTHRTADHLVKVLEADIAAGCFDPSFYRDLTNMGHFCNGPAFGNGSPSTEVTWIHWPKDGEDPVVNVVCADNNGQLYEEFASQSDVGSACTLLNPFLATITALWRLADHRDNEARVSDPDLVRKLWYIVRLICTDSAQAFRDAVREERPASLTFAAPALPPANAPARRRWYR